MSPVRQLLLEEAVIQVIFGMPARRPVLKIAVTRPIQKNATWRWSEPTCQGLVDLQLADSQICHFKYLQIVNLQRQNIHLLTATFTLSRQTQSLQHIVALTSSIGAFVLLLWHQQVYLANITSDLRLGNMPAAWDMDYFLVLNFGPVTPDGQTDGQTDRQKAMHMSPPCISTGVLKNLYLFY